MYDVQAQLNLFFPRVRQVFLQRKKMPAFTAGKPKRPGQETQYSENWCATLAALAHQAAITHIGCV
jgi:hypothetical protein